MSCTACACVNDDNNKHTLSRCHFHRQDPELDGRPGSSQYNNNLDMSTRWSRGKAGRILEGGSNTDLCVHTRTCMYMQDTHSSVHALLQPHTPPPNTPPTCTHTHLTRPVVQNTQQIPAPQAIQRGSETGEGEHNRTGQVMVSHREISPHKHPMCVRRRQRNTHAYID